MSDRTKRRHRLFEENKLCHFCKTEMTLQDGGKSKSQPQNLAVLITQINADRMPYTVLGCLKCATRINNEAQNKLGLEELRARSSPQGKCLCPNCGNTHFRTVKDSTK